MKTAGRFIAKERNLIFTPKRIRKAYDKAYWKLRFAGRHIFMTSMQDEDSLTKEAEELLKKGIV